MMKRKNNWLTALSLSSGLILAGGLIAIPAMAQKGAGDATGVARQAVQPELETISGTVTTIKIEPCEKTTGHSTTGTHILLKDSDENVWNLHLGPTASVKHVTDQLVVGQEITATVFRTDKLPKDNYVVQTLTIKDTPVRLRDENLRPVWAGPGQGPGQGFCLGKGPGHGQAKGPGKGPGSKSSNGLACMNFSAQMLANIADQGPLDEHEAAGLTELREEEKLAHDVYVALAAKWQVPIFTHISQAESRHMNAMARLLEAYRLDDPVADREAGEFSSPRFTKLYQELIQTGSGSLTEAYKVGALIEELDISDLQNVTEKSTQPLVKQVFGNLERASRNHLRAFASQLAQQEESYEARHLTQAEFDSIAESDWERGHGGQRGQGRMGQKGRGPGWGRGRGAGQENTPHRGRGPGGRHGRGQGRGAI